MISRLFSWYIWQFEKTIQHYTGKCIYLPYWDWEIDSGREWDASVFHPDTFGTWGGTRSVNGRNCVEEGIANMYDSPFQWSLGIDNGPEGCLERNFLEGFSFSGEAEVLAIITNYDQYADTTPGDNQLNGFRADFEATPHMLVHGIIAGHFDTHWSVADPLFWVHHSNVDRLWTMWQDYWDHDECHTSEYYSPWHYDGDLDERMPFRPGEIDWDFTMEHEDGSRSIPTIRDVMSNDSPFMSVRYMNDPLVSLIPGHEPNPMLFQEAIEDFGVRCDRDVWRRKLENLDLPRTEEEAADRQVTRRKMTSFTNEINYTLPVACEQRKAFNKQADQEEWERLCQELPEETSVADRFATMAEITCARKGNPRSDALKARMKMSADTPLPAFACFHRPDFHK
jgi:hypothetical protein